MSEELKPKYRPNSENPNYRRISECRVGQTVQVFPRGNDLAPFRAEIRLVRENGQQKHVIAVRSYRGGQNENLSLGEGTCVQVIWPSISMGIGDMIIGS